MNPEQITLRLPVGLHAQQGLLAILGAVLEREVGVDVAGEVVRLALRLRDLPEPGDVLAVEMERQPHQLQIRIGEEWLHTIALPSSVSDATQQQEAASGLGVGLFLVRELMDEVTYTPRPGDNRWRLTKTIAWSGSFDLIVPAVLELEINVPVSYRYLNVIGAAIEHYLQAIPGLEEREALSYNLQLAAQEICTNIIDHAYDRQLGQIRFRLFLDPASSQLVLETQDRGQFTFRLGDIPPPAFLTTAPSQGFLSGSLLLLVSTTVVNAGNYIFNLILGRWLGPAAFADLSLVITLMLVVTLITATLQTVAAKFSAIFVAQEDGDRVAGLARWMGRRTWILGIGLTLFTLLASPFLARFFHMTSIWPFVILAVGLPLYFAQGVDRGILQGQIRFGALAVSYQAEMWVRLAVAILLVLAGFGVNGAVGGLTLSFLGAWLAARWARKSLSATPLFGPEDQRQLWRFAGPVSAALMGQILINNSDVLMVKHFFAPEVAGQYAALALIGRIVFFATWSVVTALFPLVAQRHQLGQPHRHLLWLSLGAVVGVSVVIIGGSLLFPGLIVTILFGEAYAGMADLLWLYALATAFYALSNVVINYRLSLGDNAGSYLAVVGGIAQVLGVWFLHTSLAQVVWVQIGAMGGMLAILLIWDLSLWVGSRRTTSLVSIL